MDALKAWAMDLCYAAMGCALLGFLLPKGNVKKTASALLGVFMIFILFTPIAKMRKTDALSAALPEYTCAAYESPAEAAREAARQEATRVIRTLLEDGGYAFGEIRVQCHIGENGVIDINGVEIEAAEDAAEIQACVRENTGITPVIVPVEGR